MKNRPIKKMGNSFFVHLYPADVKDYGLAEGDELDMEPVFDDLLKEKKD